MRRAVVALIKNESGQLLAISRGTDLTNWGLPGGKVEPGEADDIAIVREVKEESGLTFSNHRVVYSGNCREFFVTCYEGDWSGEIQSSHEGTAEWKAREDLLQSSSFADYNRDLFNSIDCNKDTK